MEKLKILTAKHVLLKSLFSSKLTNLKAMKFNFLFDLCIIPFQYYAYSICIHILVIFYVACIINAH